MNPCVIFVHHFDSKVGHTSMGQHILKLFWDQREGVIITHLLCFSFQKGAEKHAFSFTWQILGEVASWNKRTTTPERYLTYRRGLLGF